MKEQSHLSCLLHWQVPSLVLGRVRTPAPLGERCFELFRHSGARQLSAAAMDALLPLARHMPRTVALNVEINLAEPAVVAAVGRLLRHVHTLDLCVPSSPPLWADLLAQLPLLATLSFEACFNEKSLNIAHLDSLAVAVQAAGRVVCVRVPQEDYIKVQAISTPNMPVVCASCVQC
jgi:hypothetical protein